jgi:hypothetical protein
VLEGNRASARVVQTLRFNRLSWSDQLRRLADLIRRYPEARVLCDSSSMGDPLVAELGRMIPNHHVDGLRFTSASKTQLIENLVSLVERNALRFAPDPVLLRELQCFRYNDGKLEGDREHDDMVIALALAAFHLPTEHGVAFLVGDPRRLP